MRHSSKLLLNTVALYIKILFNAAVSIFATRIVLKQLGEDEYGLYNLIAGTILLLSFLNGSMMISAQRFMSIAIGEKNQEKLKTIFNASTYIHIIVSIGIGVILLILQPILFSGILDTGSSNTTTIHIVYDIMIVSSLLTIATIPYSAAINAHEDMHYFAISEIIVILFRLIAAAALLVFTNHLLVIYTALMMLSVFIGFITKYIWCKLKYPECVIKRSLMRDKSVIKEMVGFVGWNTLGSIAVLARNQGVAVILNIFYGVTVNAAYGIANQVNSLVLTFASTLTTVFTPTIIQSKGAGDEKRMTTVALLSSKLSFLLSSIMAIPLLLFLPDILHLWLGKYPEYTTIFCHYIIITFLILQLYPGINRLIYATGKIKAYQIVISITLSSSLPLGYLFLKMGYSPETILAIVMFLQFITLLETVYYAHKQVSLNLYDTIVKYILPAIVLIVATLLISGKYTTSILEGGWLSVLGQIALIECIYIVLYMLLILNKEERNKFIKVLHIR